MKNQSFYTVLSEYYDEIFPWDTDIDRFLAYRLSQCTEILDLACGTGTYSCSLAERGHSVSGIDLDQEMVRQSAQKAAHLGPAGHPDAGGGVSFFQGSMTEPEKYINRQVDAAFCIGNSIPHLSDRKEVLSMLKNIRRLMRSKGVLVIQIINFDRFADKKSAELPTLHAENVSFFRNYSHITEVKVDFDTTIKVKNSGSEFQQSVQLLCLKKHELEQLINLAGFKNVSFLGSYDEKPYTQESFLTIACANV